MVLLRARGGRYENLLETGVIDPATVTQQAVLNSCSIAASVITTSALITEIKEPELGMNEMAEMGGMGGGMGGMGGMGM